MIKDSNITEDSNGDFQSKYNTPEAPSIRIPVLFDVVLLAGLESHLSREIRTNIRPMIMAPGCPMLTQGWAYIDSYRGKLNPAVLRAGRHLQPGLWTTFTFEGVSILREALQTGKLI